MSATIHFGTIDRLVVFGGGRLVAELAPRLSASSLKPVVVSSPRHLEEGVGADGASLARTLEACGLPALSVEDVNSDPRVTPLLGASVFGLAIGPAWIFRAPILGPMTPRMVNFHGIRLPQYRGGAHYSWQILRRNRQGACNIQLIEPALDTGAIIKRREYFFPGTARIPRDYFEAAIREELGFLDEFLAELQAGRTFPMSPLLETFSTYFPRLNTLRQGLINWDWSTSDLDVFVAAFDEPYRGASTFVDGRRVFLKDCSAEFGDGPFHPFQAGIVYRKTPEALFVATRDGTLVVRSVTDEGGADARADIKLGHRFYTPRHELDAAMTYHAVYSARGVNP